MLECLARLYAGPFFMRLSHQIHMTVTRFGDLRMAKTQHGESNEKLSNPRRRLRRYHLCGCRQYGPSQIYRVKPRQQF